MNPLPVWLIPRRDSLFRSRERLHHALLFTGPEGVGKEWLARALAGALLCDAPSQSGEACGRCSACRWYGQDVHPDFRLIRPSADDAPDPEAEGGSTRASKASRDIRIEQIRALAGFVEIASHRGGEKVILIAPAEAMNPAAANALLKTLEEPPPGTRFLLVSSRSERLPATVRSRCQMVPIPTPPLAEALDWLVGQTRSDPQRAREWLSFCGGAPRRAAELAEAERLGLHRALAEVFARGGRGDPAGTVDRVAACELREWVPILHAWCIDLARCATGATPRYFPAHSDWLAPLAELADRGRLLEFERWLSQLGRLVSHPLNARLAAEDAVGRYRAVFRQAPSRSVDASVQRPVGGVVSGQQSGGPR